MKKTTKRLLCLLLVLLLALPFMASCKKEDEKGPESEFKKLTNAADKFFVTESNETKALSTGLTSIVGGINSFELDENLTESVYAAKLGFKLDKIKSGGMSINLGGDITADMVLDLKNGLSQTDINATLLGDTAKATLTSDDKNGDIFLSLGDWLEKPAYITADDLSALLLGAASSGSVGSDDPLFGSDGGYYGFEESTSASDIAIILPIIKVVSEYISEDNIKHVFELIKGSVPSEYFTESKANVEVAGDYINKSLETTLVSLVLDSDKAAVIVKNALNAAKGDALITEIANKVIAAAGITDKTFANVIDEALAKLDTILEDDSSDGATLTINRYFYKGSSVKTEIFFTDISDISNEPVEEFRLVVEGLKEDSKLQYSASLFSNEEQILALKGGNDGKNGDFEAKAGDSVIAFTTEKEGSTTTTQFTVTDTAKAALGVDENGAEYKPFELKIVSNLKTDKKDKYETELTVSFEAEGANIEFVLTVMIEKRDSASITVPSKDNVYDLSDETQLKQFTDDVTAAATEKLPNIMNLIGQLGGQPPLAA